MLTVITTLFTEIPFKLCLTYLNQIYFSMMQHENHDNVDYHDHNIVTLIFWNENAFQ